MKFENFTVNHCVENDMAIIKISAPNKDGLLIGKNGQNLLAIQYLLSIILDRKLKKHVPFAVNVDSYMEKRSAYLKGLARTLAERALHENSEAVTDYLPAYERKIIHEEISSMQPLKTFSVGRGPYKKVVITALL
jgi:spoIIIJ-associated protein